MKKTVWLGALGLLLLMGAARNTPWERHLSGTQTNTVILPPSNVEVFSLFRVGGTDTVSVYFRRTATDSVLFTVLPRADTTIPVIIKFEKDDPDIRTDFGLRVIKASGTVLHIMGSH